MLLAEPADLFGRAPPAAAAITADSPQIAVIDGETLRLRDTVIRLLGIVAPPHGTLCRRADGSAFDCGTASADALAQLVRDHAIACQLRGHDRAGRPLGICEAGGQQLNRAQVVDGWARADTDTLVPDLARGELARGESDARAGRRGLWAGVVDQRS